VIAFMPLQDSAHQRLRAYLHQTRLLGSISSALYYDQNTVMPSEGASWRGEQLALLAGQLHERQTSAAYADLLAEAEAELAAAAVEMANGQPGMPQQRRNLQLLREELNRESCLDSTLVSRLAIARARGYACWQEARSSSEFERFAPALQDLIQLRREQAAQLADGAAWENGAGDGVERSCWETLAQRFEPGISKARLQELFGPLRQRLPELLAAVAERRGAPPPDWDLPEAQQDRLCHDLLIGWGWDGARCQRARSPHPFSCTLGPDDFRITTRVVAGQPLSSFLATAHEWGHSLYEQGLPRSGDHWFPWPLGDATSMGVHESQSLFWECRVARGEAFARRWQPRFAEVLGSDPWELDRRGSVHGFWRALNPLSPGLNRVEADELSYCLHIVLRWELELALLEEDLPVAELPALWNRRMGELLGVVPTSDAEGCLQDVHWSEGLFGYFPSYAIGHLISAQIAEAMERDLGAIEQRVADGEEALLRRWLAERVWPLGRSVDSEELVRRVSGRPLSAEPFLTYLEDKLERLLD
jgi:carboxypeptidase Taq